jgi:hypothetical protein
MAIVKNLAYYGNTGTILIDGDTHVGVTSFVLTPTTPEEQVADIGGDVQAMTGVPTWRAAVEFHQDHTTADSLSKVSATLAGTVVPIVYTPQSGGAGRSVNVRMKHAAIGGGTARHVGNLDLAVIGQPVATP